MSKALKLVSQNGNSTWKVSAAEQAHASSIVENLDTRFSGTYEDLPRLVHPATGVDDTDKIIAIIEEQYPVLPWYPDQKHNRRALYMAIHSLRKNSKQAGGTGIGWQCDKEVKKGDYAQEIGQSRLN